MKLNRVAHPRTKIRFTMGGVMLVFCALFQGLVQAASTPPDPATFLEAAYPMSAGNSLVDTTGHFPGQLTAFDAQPFAMGPQTGTSALNFGAKSVATILLRTGSGPTVSFDTLTFTTWFKSTAGGQPTTIASGLDTVGSTWTLGADRNGVPFLTLTIFHGQPQQLTGSGDLYDGKWHQLIATVSSHHARLFVDQTASEATVLWLGSKGQSLVLGALGANSAFTLGPTQLYSQPLTLSMVSQLTGVTYRSTPLLQGQTVKAAATTPTYPYAETTVNLQAGGAGSFPNGNLIEDSAGNFYGTGQGGPAFSSPGGVFELVAPNLSEVDLTTALGGTAGYYPKSGLLMDSAGNFYGTYSQGPDGSTAAGQFFSFSLINPNNFSEIDLTDSPIGIMRDTSGNIFLTGSSTVIEVPYANGTLGPAVTLYDLGSQASGNLIMDAQKNLYGVTEFGGTAGDGMVYELPYNNGAYGTEITLHNFTGGSDGMTPSGSLTFDSAGNLFGATLNGGANSAGTVFEIPHGASGFGAEKIIYTFGLQPDGKNPNGSLIIDAAGNIYGTTQNGGLGNGTVFELPYNNGLYGTGKVLYSFPVGVYGAPSNDGFTPQPGLILDGAGELIGTTVEGGDTSIYDFGAGTVFILKPYATITAVTPSSGSTSGGTTVTVTGNGFSGTTQVLFGTKSALSFTVQSPTQLVATSPANAVGVDDITVTTPLGTSSPSVADQFTYQIISLPVITSLTSATAQVGRAFSYSITASNSPTSYAATGLPAGLSLNTSTGALTGAPTTAGKSSITLSATNAGGTGTATLTLTVNPPTPVISSATTATAQVGKAFSYTITASNSPTSFAATGLPAGLSLNTSTGALTGTPTTAGKFSITLSATNPGGTGTATLALTVNPPTPVISSAPSATAQVGQTFSYSITASNSPTSYAATGLPAGLSINASTGVISGTPTTPATSTITLNATNAGGTGTAKLTLIVNPVKPVISSATSATAQVGQAFSYSITASNSPTSYAATGLPAGLSLNTSTGALTGTPTTAGKSSITLSATNAGGAGTATLTLTVYPPAPVITSAITATGTTGTAFSYSIAASNSPTSYAATGLPAGLSINAITGVISGTPTTVGKSTITLNATNAGGTGTAKLTLTVNPPIPVISSATSATAQVGQAFSYTVTASNSPTSYAATGLPAGLSLNTSTGAMTGTPTTAGKSSITLSATNAGETGTATLVLTVNPPSPVISSATSATVTTGTAFNYTITASNSPTSFSTSHLYQKLTGTIIGTPGSYKNQGSTINKAFDGDSTTYFDSPQASGSWLGLDLGASNTAPVGQIKYICRSSFGSRMVGGSFQTSSVADFSSNVVTLATITTAPANGVSVVVPITGAAAQRYVRYLSPNNSYGSIAELEFDTALTASLPPGLNLNATTGSITGTPTQIGAWSFQLAATNAGGTGTATLTLTVNPPIPVITSATTATGTTGTAFSYTILASNSPTSFAATGLPAGLSINATTGVISGTPTTAAISTITLNATNAGGTGTATLTLTVAPINTKGLLNWYKADAGVTQDANGNVSQWTDQTGNYPVTQTTAGNQPTYVANDSNGKPALRFNGSQWLQNPNAANTGLNADMTMVTVAQTSVKGTPEYSIWLGSGNNTKTNRSMGYVNGSEIMDAFGVSSLGGAQLNPNTFGLETASVNAALSAVNFTQNGGPIQTSAITGLQNVSAGITVGSVGPISEYQWQGDIAEVLVYDHQLSATEMQQVGVYLADKYGLYNPNATWPKAYSAAVQAEITRNQWNKQQADNYVALQKNNPTMLTNGLAAWFKADAGVTQDANGNVSQWADQTGNSYVAQATPAQQPTYIANDAGSKPGLRFSGNQWLTGTGLASPGLNQDITLITVALPRAPAAFQGTFYLGNESSGQNMRGIGYYQSRELLDTYNGFIEGGSAPVNDVFIEEAATIDTSLNVTFYKNGLQTATGALGGAAPVTTGISIGTRAPNDGAFQGDIAEVLIYDHQLSATELQQVSVYLADKYGLYNPNATWPKAYSAAVQAEITRNQWNKQQADNYVALQKNNPTMLTNGLAAWFKADAGVTQDANGNVSQWADQTGNSYVAQATPAQQPTYIANDAGSKPGLRFSGNQWLTGTGLASPGLNQDITLITVALPRAPAAFQGTFYLGNESSGQNMRGIGYYQSRELLDTYNGFIEGGSAPVNDVFIEEAATIDTSLNVTFYKNGLQTATGALGGAAPVTTGISIGTRAPNDGAFQGDIAEVLIYDHQLSASDLQQVGVYLADKYGLYNPNATWPKAYSAVVQAEITRNQWNKQQADNYVALQKNNPTMLTNGLAAWFKADAGVTQDANGNVSQWADQTGNYPVTQTAAGTQPTYVANDSNGKPALRFNGSQSLFNSSNLGAGVNADLTLITVASTSNPSSQQYSVALGSTGSGSTRSLGYDQNQELFDASYIYAQGAPSPAAGVFTLEMATLDSTRQNVAFYQNGLASGTATLTGLVNVGAGLSVGTATFGNNWQGDIAEVLVYDHQLSTTELQQVGVYLAEKYNISTYQSAPVISPNGGSFNPTATVTITPPFSGGILHDTIDGSEVTASSPVYTGTLMLTASALVKAAIFSPSGVPLSLQSSAQFYVNDPNQTGLATVPTHLQVTATSSTQLNLSWTIPGSVTYQAINIYRQTGGSGPYVLIATINANATNYTDSTVMPGTTYQYQVGTVNQAGIALSTSSSGSSPVASPVLSIVVTTPAGAINLP